MAEQMAELKGPDLKQGVPSAQLRHGTLLLGHADGEAVLVSRVEGECYGIGAICTHYSGPLAEGFAVGDTIRCPWHHACFSLKTRAALRPPALNDLPCWRVEEREARIFVREKIERRSAPPPPRNTPRSVAIIGAGAAGQSAAETLRREGYAGPITMFDANPSEPVDRPNLSKDYLAGNAQPEWIPLRDADWFAQHHVEVVRSEVRGLDARSRQVTPGDGTARAFDAIILAPGADPIRLDLAGPAGGPRVLYLRTLADSDAIIAAVSGGAKRVVVLGASFIGLEAAASLRARGLEVHVAAPDSRPLERVLGPELGDHIRALHEAKGVVFHLGRLAKGLDRGHVVLDDGSRLAADVVVAGVGVRPRTALSEAAGLRHDKGIVVNEHLETSAPGIFAAGDAARWPDPHTGQAIRVEHWVLAERMGQAAARSVLGARERFAAVPFFWSAHYDVTIRYVGHAPRWDRIDMNGAPADGECTMHYVVGGKTHAVATLSRDRENLEAEARIERAMA